MTLHRVFASEPFVFDLITPVALGDIVAWGCEPDEPESGWLWPDGVTWQWSLLSADPEADRFMEDAEPEDVVVHGKLVAISEVRAAYRQDSHDRTVIWVPESYRLVEQTRTTPMPDPTRTPEDEFVAYVFGIESDGVSPVPSPGTGRQVSAVDPGATE